MICVWNLQFNLVIIWIGYAKWYDYERAMMQLMNIDDKSFKQQILTVISG